MKRLLVVALLSAVLISTPVTAYAAEVKRVQFQNGVCIIVSNIGCPEIEIPDADKPDTDTPDTPDADKPGMDVPETPDADKPDTDTPNTSDTDKPGMDVPETPDADKPDMDAPNTPDKEDTPDKEELSYAEQVIKLVNEERAKAGLSAVEMEADITAAANVRAKEIKQSFSHTRPNGSSFSSALKEQGVSYSGSGENIAYGQKSPEKVMEAWMNSDGHRANILNAKFKNIGVGYYQDEKGVNYWVQIFTY